MPQSIAQQGRWERRGREGGTFFFIIIPVYNRKVFLQFKKYSMTLSYRFFSLLDTRSLYLRFASHSGCKPYLSFSLLCCFQTSLLLAALVLWWWYLYNCASVTCRRWRPSGKQHLANRTPCHLPPQQTKACEFFSTRKQWHMLLRA